VEPFKQGAVPTFRTLGAEFEYVGLAQVRINGKEKKRCMKNTDNKK